jgi:vacuolar protein sorting-associated protein 13A/C
MYSSTAITRSPPINIEDIGSVHFRLQAPGNPDSSIRLIRADVQIDGSTIFITISASKDGWPFVIENESDHSIELYQKVSLQQNYFICKFDTHITMSALPLRTSTATSKRYPASRTQSTL